MSGIASGIWIIFSKELREILRDRKTLIFMLALPTLIVPVLLSLAVDFAIKADSKASSEILDFAVFAEERLPGLAEAFDETPGFERVSLASQDQIIGAVHRGDIDFALVVQPPEPAGAGAAGTQTTQTTVEIYYDNASSTSKARKRAGAVIEALSISQRGARLESLGVPAEAQPRLLEPVTISERNTYDMRAVVGERVGGMIPYFFIMFCFLGALFPAIDLGAGEKERGTLETLLLVPLERRQLVLGKYLVIFAAATTAALLSLLSLGAWLFIKGRDLAGDAGGQIVARIIESIGAADLLLIAAMLVPTGAIIAALLLSIAIYAKSFKEAQSYSAPLQFLILVPAFLGLLPGVTLTWGWAMVPITNMALAVKELTKGTMSYPMLGAILGSSMILAGALLTFCTWWFGRESVLFRR